MALSHRFRSDDFTHSLPPAGFYSCSIEAADVLDSQSGHEMLRVVFALEGVDLAHDRVWEYFVLQGVSPRGLAVARRRLVQLYHACGLRPADGDLIRPSDLHDARLEVKIEHTSYDGEARMRVAGYRPAFCGALFGTHPRQGDAP